MRLTLQIGKRTAWMEVTRMEKLIRLYTDSTGPTLELKQALYTWCSTGEGRPDQRLQFRSSGCGCDNSKIYQWTFPASMLREFGPLPFTAAGTEIRWRWWHYFGQDASFEITEDDLLQEAP